MILRRDLSAQLPRDIRLGMDFLPRRTSPYRTIFTRNNILLGGVGHIMSVSWTAFAMGTATATAPFIPIEKPIWRRDKFVDFRDGVCSLPLRRKAAVIRVVQGDITRVVRLNVRYEAPLDNG